MECRTGDMHLLLNSAENQKINNSWLLIYVRSGAGMVHRSGSLMCLDEGDILFFPPGARIAFDSKTLGDEYNASVNASVLYFDEHWLDGLLRLFPSNSQLVLALKEQSRPCRILGTKWLRISGLLDRLSVSESHRDAAIILDLLECLADPSDIYPIAEDILPLPDVSEKKDRIERYISCHLLGRVTLDQIAAYSGMNRTYFCLFFKKHYGISLTEYVNRKRIEIACSMLHQGNVPVSDIAKACGFPTVTYFNRVFKKVKGVSPIKYLPLSKIK